MRRLAALALASALLGAVQPGCSDHDATAVLLALSSEADVPDQIDAIALEVRRGERVTFAQRYRVDQATRQVKLPGTLTFQPEDDDELSTPLRIAIRAEQRGEQVSLRSATMGFIEGKQKLLRLVIRYSCLDFAKACGAGETCIGGTCAPDAIDAARLPDFTGDEPFPTVAEGGCFDASDAACAAGRRDIDTDAFLAAGCRLDASGTPGFDPARLNVFAFWKAQIDQGHPIVLDRDPDDLPPGQPGEGWSLVAGTTGTLRLAAGLCGLLAAGTLDRLSYNLACPTKTLAQPICLPVTGGPRLTLADSDCVTCTYFDPADACWTAATGAADATDVFACARSCPFDGRYDTADECRASERCFFDCLAPLLACETVDCPGYAQAAAWRECVAGLPPVGERCASRCAPDNVALCHAP